MFELLNDISLIILDVICFRIFFDALFPGTNEADKRKSCVFFLIHIISFLIVIKLLASIFWLKEAGIILTTSIIMCHLKKIRFSRALVASFGFLMIMVLIDFAALYAIYVLFDPFYVSDIGDTVSGRLIVIVEKTCLLLVDLFLKMRADKRKGKGLVETEWLRFIFFPIFTVISSVAMAVVFNDVQDMTKTSVLYAVAFGLVIMNVFMYYLIDDVIKREIKIKERELQYVQSQSKIDVYKTLEDGLEKQRQNAHEFKNHIMCVDALIKDRDYEALEKYVSDLGDSAYMDRNTIDTNNVIVNTILNEKYHKMAEKGIVFVFRINDLFGISIEDEDLVVILSNLLDNAIEACEKCDGERTIKLKFMTEEDLLILSVKNPCAELPVLENGIYQTSKLSERENHGIGITNIQRVIEKYKGTYSIRHSENEFYFAILFPMECRQ